MSPTPRMWWHSVQSSVNLLARLCAKSRTPSDMGLRHQYFIARTVLVRNGNVDEAVRLLNR